MFYKRQNWSIIWEVFTNLVEPINYRSLIHCIFGSCPQSIGNLIWNRWRKRTPQRRASLPFAAGPWAWRSQSSSAARTLPLRRRGRARHLRDSSDDRVFCTDRSVDLQRSDRTCNSWIKNFTSASLVYTW